ncbi:MAG: Hpt domain-containing protein [Rhodobacteraceae bacterium]|nr:Hpt domain-containing protein [Paracoccaceae bacterium]
MKNQIQNLIIKHCSTIAREAEAIRLCLDCFDQDVTSATDMLENAIQHAHKIKGSSGSLGFPDISAAAACLERQFRIVHLSEEEMGLSERIQIQAYYAILEQLVSNATPEASTLYDYKLPANAPR